MNVWKAVASVLAAGAGLVLVLVLGGRYEGAALLAYVLCAGAAGLGVLARRVAVALPPAVPFGRLLARPPRQVEPVRQLETIRRGLSAATWSDAELRFRLAPMVREIAAARLSRRYGVDLGRQPDQARAVIGGGRVWELAAPRGMAPGREPGGWSAQELQELLDELEAI